eukprot:292238-Chlamydomonas_euryale.AAC.5
MEGSHRPPGRPHASPLELGQQKQKGGRSGQEPWGRVSMVLGPHIPVGSIYPVEPPRLSRATLAC